MAIGAAEHVTSRRARFRLLIRRTRGIVGALFVFLVVISALDGFGIWQLRRQFSTPLVVDVTSRQRALVNRYVKDVVLKLDGVQADPGEDAAALERAAIGLVHGGLVPSPQGNLDDLVRVPPPADATVRLKLTNELRLIRQLAEQGTALLREGRTAPSFARDLYALRVKGAQLSSVTGDAAGEETRHAQADLASLVRIQFAVGTLGAMAAIGMALLLRRSARRQSGRFRSLVHNSSDLITVVDKFAIASYQSPSSIRVLGYEPAEVVGTNLTRLLHPGDRARIVQTFAGLYDHPDETVELHCRMRHRNGAWILMEGTIRNLVEDSAVGGFVVNTRDVTERARIAEELAAARDAAMEATRLKSEFLASMSHEIRTPMNAVIGLSDLLLGTALDQAQREYASGVNAAAEGLLAIINDILDFSKVEAGKLQLEIIDFSISGLLDDVAGLLGERAHAKSLELLAHAYPDLPQNVRGDPTRLRQVLINLVSNAVKFTSAGEVVLRAIPLSDDGTVAVVRFEVGDTGMGIAPEDQVRMFEPFSQADSSTTRRFGGTGLGLAIVGQLVELMGGKLGLESEVDRGSTFWFELPFESAAAAAAGIAAADASALEAMRTIVVDDNATNRLILRQQLASWGIQPDEADGAGIALQQFRTAAACGEPYDLAIIDLNMPDMDGLELARAIKADPTTAGAKLFLLSSSGRVADDVAAEAQLSGTLAKPVRQSDLFDRIIEGLHGADTPHDAKPVELASVPVANDEPNDHEGLVVLLVEDNDMNQLVATRMLAKLGYRVDVASNGREALAAIAAGSYAAVLMDCQMPEMDGYEATRRLRSLEVRTGEHLPVIAMTAAAMQGDREVCLEAGMDDYITKPVRPGAINEALERWISTEAAPRGDADPEEPGALSVLDSERFAVLRDLDSGDGELLAAIISGYVDEGAVLLGSLREALGEGDPQSVERAAHTLKGASANVGALRVADCCARLEALGRAAALGTALPILEATVAEFELVRAALLVEASAI